MTNDHRRAQHFKAETIALRKRIRALERELKETHARSFAIGSSHTMAAVHDALDDGDLSLWISQRLLAQRRKCPPFNLSPEKQAMVRSEIAALLKACRIKSHVDEIAL
jgi:hypothetical protein